MNKLAGIFLFVLVARVFIPFCPPPVEYRINSANDIVRVKDKHYQIKTINGKTIDIFGTSVIIVEDRSGPIETK